MAGAAQYLQNLPSRGCFSQPSATSTGGMKVYVCQHDTAPPDEQLIKTDSTNILIRALTLKKEKGRTDQKAKDSKGKVVTAAASTPEEGKGKRPAERQLEDKPALKRANTANGSTPDRKEEGSSRLSGKNLQVCTVQQLKAMLKEMNLPLKGNKEELIARLLKEQKR
ncbi:unnamed protein product [Sphagnum jensenii]|uniref:SAP domain-containing protein n=1 Tax=Sphagnum jensenii TaxID=128206 RepID=A0ABP0X1Z2_9BRYO